MTKVTKDIEVEIEETLVELELVEKKTQTPRAPLVQQRKFMDYLKEKSSTKDLLDKIID